MDASRVKTEVFILKKKSLLHRDVIVTMFSHDFGKMSAIAKGVKKLTSRRAAHLQTGNLIRVQLQKSHEVWYLRSTELLSGFTKVRDHAKSDALYLYLYVLDRMLPAEQNEYEIYKLTKQFFIELSKPGADPQAILTVILQKTLNSLGYGEQDYTLSKLLTIVESNIQEKLPSPML